MQQWYTVSKILLKFSDIIIKNELPRRAIQHLCGSVEHYLYVRKECSKQLLMWQKYAIKIFTIIINSEDKQDEKRNEKCFILFSILSFMKIDVCVVYLIFIHITRVYFPYVNVTCRYAVFSFGKENIIQTTMKTRKVSVELFF